MNNQEIKSNLCYYDSENPNNNIYAYDNGDCPPPRKECACDNCFYGRDKLAVKLLETQRELNEMTLRWEQTNDALFNERALYRLSGVCRELKAENEQLNQQKQ